MITHQNNIDEQGILLLPSYKGYHVVKISDIIRIQAVSNYSKLVFNNGRSIVVSKVLAWFEKKLHTKYFIRIHRTHLVNTHFISTYNLSGKKGLKLSNGENISVSRRKRSQLKYLMNTLAA